MRSTQFDEDFPFEVEPEQRGRSKSHTPSEQNSSKDRIVLCTDDRPLLLELRKAALASHGFCIKTASNGFAPTTGRAPACGPASRPSDQRHAGARRAS